MGSRSEREDASARGDGLAAALAALSPGAWVITALALGSSLLIAFLPGRAASTLEMWTFTRAHAVMYEPEIARWNQEHPDADAHILILNAPALQQRMLAGFLAETAVADLIEAERKIAGQAFAGPLDKVGFVDLTDWLRDEGLMEEINPPSFGPWTSRGRIFGLPHDVHPVMLCYRADIVEAAGIDVSTIDTWDDFERVLAPLMDDGNGDGQPDHRLLAIQENYGDQIELLTLQAGGRYFDEAGRPTLNLPENARVLARITQWCTGPLPIAAHAPDFQAAGNQVKKSGQVIAWFAPDWMCYLIRNEIPELSGKLKLMPLPAWDPGGRHTSVWGGTMLGISRTTDEPDKALALARRLYLSEDLARTLYRQGDIITPIRSHWDNPMFDEPDPFYSNQPKGRMYINLAPDVPVRTNSPYFSQAVLRVQDASIKLKQWSVEHGVRETEALEARAMELLEVAQDAVMQHLSRNIFLSGEAGAGDS
ncbi:MAG: carbohydrate ABC transporter substrate-binding protein [Phycisphaerales bacterium]|nr:carbohydrate ABC transporter substrate-binding protein [Phycisphaerales bacterium]